MEKVSSLGLMVQSTKESILMERSTAMVPSHTHQERHTLDSGEMVSKKARGNFPTHNQTS